MKHNHMKLFLSPEFFFLKADGGATAWVAPPWIRHCGQVTTSDKLVMLNRTQLNLNVRHDIYEK